MCRLSEFVIHSFKKMVHSNANVNLTHTREFVKNVSIGWITYSALSLPYYGLKIIH
jgi:hypothetical protein